MCASHGYRASGGPVGVGMAVGEALNLTLVLVMFVNLLLSYLFWGVAATFWGAAGVVSAFPGSGKPVYPPG